MSYPSLLKVRHELPPLYKMAERLRDDRGRFEESTPEKKKKTNLKNDHDYFGRHVCDGKDTE